MHLNNGTDEVAPIVLIFAVPTMREGGDMYIQKVIGLRNTAHPDSYGYIIFSKTRAGSAAVWRWFFLQFAIPIIARAVAERSYSEEDSSDEVINLQIASFTYILSSLCAALFAEAVILVDGWRGSHC